MRPENNSFDDSIRQKLSNDEEPVSAGLWEKIDTGIKQNSVKAKKNYVRYSALLLLLLLSGIFVWQINSENSFDNKTKLAQPELPPAKNSVASNPGQDKNSDAAGVQLNDNSENNLPSAISNNSLVSSFEKKNKKAAPVLVAAANIPGSSLNDFENPVSDNANENQKPQTTETNLQNATSADEALNESTVTEENTASEIVLVPASNTEYPEVKDSLKLPLDKTKKNFGFEIFYSPDFVKKSMEINFADNEYLNMRADMEQGAFAHSTGIEFFCKVGKHVELKTGIIYSEIQEQLHYTFYAGLPVTPAIRTHTIKGIFVDPLTGFISSSDTTVSNYLIPGDIVHSNNYYFYNIPFEISFIKEIKSFVIALEVGAFMNFSFKQKGSIINTDRYSKINFDNENLNPYRKSTGAGSIAGLYAGYNISSHIRFFINPELRYYLHKINKTNAPLNERLYSISATSGLRFEF